MSRSPRRSALALAVLLGAVACASVPPPVDRVEAARQAVFAAERGGAHEHAPLELYVARERIDEARQALADEDFVEARRRADDALVYAELARAKSRAAENQLAVDEVKVELELIERDLERRQRTR